MADEVEVEFLKAGQTPLVGCDFRNADLSELALANREFRDCMLNGVKAQNTDFSRCIISGNPLIGLQANGANFTEAQLRSTVLQGCNFENAIFRRAIIAAPVISKTNFSGADLRGARFQSVRFQDGNIFNNAIVDAQTDFRNSRITRAAAQHSVFKYFEYKDGTLVRKTPLGVTESVGTDSATVSLPDSFETSAKPKEPQSHEDLHSRLFRIVSQEGAEERKTILVIRTLIDGEMARLGEWRPNDQENIACRDATIKFLSDASAKLGEIISQAQSHGTEVERAATLVEEIGQALDAWLRDNARNLVHTPMNVGVIAVLGWLMTSVFGCPALLSFPIVAAHMSGKNPFEALVELLKAYRKDT